MTPQENANFVLKRLPNEMVYATVGVCLIPLVVSLFGYKFEFGGSLGSMVHALLEWSALSIALLTCVLAFANYSVRKDPATPIIGLTLLCVGLIDTFHILVSTRVIEGAANYEDLVSLSWTLSRLFNAVICLVGVGIFIVSANINRRKGLKFIVSISATFLFLALASCLVIYFSPVVPKASFPGQFLARPWDTLPLVIFGFRAYVFYLFYSRYPSPFSFAMMLSSVPDILSQGYMSFGGGGMHDHSANAAHFLKVVSYSLPFVGLCFDYITSHKKMSSIQRELRASVERFDLAVAGSNEGLWDWDLIKQEVYFAPRFKEFLGYEEKAFENDWKTFEEHLSEEGREIVAKKLSDHLSHRTPFDVECRVCRSDESFGWIRIRGQALWDVEGRPTRISGSISDIDQMKRAQMALEEERRRAEEASKAKSEFVANMSHEIRTPMNSIVGMADLLEQTKLDEVQERYVTTLRRSGDTLLSIINDILDFSKVEAGQLAIKNEPFDITGLMSRVEEIFSIPAEEKKIDLIFHIDPQMPTQFVGDAFRLRQVLLNLVGNAIKFTLDGGVIAVNVTANFQAGRDYELVFSVKDTGIGISDSHKDKIFESFTQAGSSVAEQYGGTGLGLAICSRIAGLMGGKIGVESRLGDGSTFIFTARLKIHEKGNQEIDILTLDMKGRRVIVVDDVPVNRVILKETLQSCGAMVEEAQSGDEAYDRLMRCKENRVQFDLAILDGRMPGMDGFELAERIREEKLPVSTTMLLTSDDRPQVIEKLSRLGVEHYLVKPVRRGDLLQIIQRSLFKDLREEESVGEVVSGVQSLKLLLVDDNPDNRMLIQSYLRDLPYEIEIADDGTTAIEKFYKNKYDLVLMDVRMKIMNGYEATRKIRDWERKNNYTMTPVLALTAYAMKKDIEEATDAGCNGHLAKPIRRKELLEAIEIHTRVRLQEPSAISEEESSATILKIDRELVEQLSDLIPSFLDNRDADIQTLLDALSVNDFEKIETLGHNMAGTAPGYGFPELGTIGEGLEDAAIEKDRDTIEKKINELKHVMERVRQELVA